MASTTIQLSRCILRFIAQVICSNPILKGAFVTAINSLILTLDAEITILTANLAVLNVIQAATNLEIQTVRAIVNSVSSTLNVITGPVGSSLAASSCPELARLTNAIQTPAIGKQMLALQRLIDKANQYANLAVYIDALIKEKNQLRDFCQAFINDGINKLCP